MTCRRCGIETPYLDKDRRCRQCAHEVAMLLRRDAERRRTRWTPKDLTGAAR